MHVLYLHQYFSTPSAHMGTRSHDLARRLVDRGHAVTMLASGRHSPCGLEAGRGRTHTTHECDGIRVVALDAAYNDHRVGTGMAGWRRMLEFKRFERLAVRVGRSLEPPDVVYASHSPHTAGQAGYRIARRFGVPFVYEVRDLWPESLVHCGALRNPLVIAYLRRASDRLYRKAAHVVTLAPDMKARICERGVPASRVTVISHGCDTELFPDEAGRPRSDAARSDEAPFRAIYFGAMGFANGLDCVVRAADEIARRGRSDIEIVFLGQGSRLPELRELASSLGVDNVRFHDVVPRTELPQWIGGCDVSLMIFRVERSGQILCPQKMFEGLAAGRPIVFNLDGWVRELLEGHDCGVYVEPGRPESLADALIALADDRARVRRQGENARKLALASFSWDHLAGRLEELLVSVAERPRAVGT